LCSSEHTAMGPSLLGIVFKRMHSAESFALLLYAEVLQKLKDGLILRFVPLRVAISERASGRSEIDVARLRRKARKAARESPEWR
jgi:hypothetical protein